MIESLCDKCANLRCIPETRYEPAEYYCDYESTKIDEYGYDDDGNPCPEFEERSEMYE